VFTKQLCKVWFLIKWDLLNIQDATACSLDKNELESLNCCICWTVFVILIKLQDMADWILICKLCKFGKYICYNFIDIKFFLYVCCTGCRDLFNAAFVSCWTELSEMQQDELIQSIEQALAIQDIPEITQTLLNLAEFMEHCEKVFIIYLLLFICVFVCYCLLLYIIFFIYSNSNNKLFLLPQIQRSYVSECSYVSRKRFC